MKAFGSFSDAIRHGATLNPQGFGHLTNLRGETCAMGAGVRAMGYENTEEGWPLVARQFPYLVQKRSAIPCPADCGLTYTILKLSVVHLNDGHQWTREAIADWLQEREDEIGYVTLTETESQSVITEPSLAMK